MKTKIKWSMFILSLLALLLFITPIKTYSQNVGDAAPDFTLSVLGGGASFQLSNEKGKVVFIFLFGFACPHCLANGNNTETGIYNVYKSNSDFVAVGVDTWDGNASGVQNFKSSTGLTYPLCLNGSSVLGTYNTSYDRIIVVDKEGIIRYKSVANSTSDVVTAAGSVIAELLSGNNTNPGDTTMNPGDSTMNPGDTATSPDDTAMSPSAISKIADDSRSLKVYPIPAYDMVHVESSFNQGETATVRIINTSGKIVTETTNTLVSGENTISIPLNNLMNGMYYLQLITPEKILTRKLIINRN
jgi:peroxiredoxin